MEIIDEFFYRAHEHDAHCADRKAVSWELIVLLGFNTSYRVSDFTRLRVKELLDIDHFTTRAKKTGKECRVKCKPRTQRNLRRLLFGRGENEYALPGRKLRRSGQRPITRQRVYQILNELAAQVGYDEKIGCHTLRKTFGYWYYKTSGHDVAKLMELFGHSDESITLRYIGVKDDDHDAVIDNMPDFCYKERKERRRERGAETDT